MNRQLAHGRFSDEFGLWTRYENSRANLNFNVAKSSAPQEVLKGRARKSTCQELFDLHPLL